MSYRPGSLLDDVEQAAIRYREHANAAEEARGALYAAILAAHEEGVSNAKVAAASGLSRERVRQIVERRSRR